MKKYNNTIASDKQLNLYDLAGIFLIGCFLGVVVEMLYYYAMMGEFQSRHGLVIGPFNLVYGFGALALTLAVFWLRNKNDIIIFLSSMAVGSAVEYICSFTQEKLIGSVSWDYSHMPFNINGRVCLLYSFYWGILGIIWLRVILPLFLRWLTKIPEKWHSKLTTMIIVFFIFNSLLTSACLIRWNQRVKHPERNQNSVIFIDSYYNNERMKSLFPNMDFSRSSDK